LEEQGGLNLYGYVGSRPISEWDPLGLIEGSTNNLIRRGALNDAANQSVGTKDYNYDVATPRTGANKLKCTDYVFGISRANKKTPRIPTIPDGKGGRMYPLASQLADPNVNLPNWRMLAPGETPQPGDVASTGIHAGIVTDNSEGNVSAHVTCNANGSAVYGLAGQFSGNANTRYRRYIGE
jgi:hypothetical protein